MKNGMWEVFVFFVFYSNITKTPEWKNENLFEHEVTPQANVHRYRSFRMMYLVPYLAAVLKISYWPFPVRWTRMKGR